MKALSGNKFSLLLILLILIGMFTYRNFFSSELEITGESALVIGQDVLKLSNELSRATLSRDLFSTPGYLYLTDFSVPVPIQILGRNNPFAAIE